MTKSTIEILCNAFIENEALIRYSTESLCKRFNASVEEIREARSCYKDSKKIKITVGKKDTVIRKESKINYEQGEIKGEIVVSEEINPEDQSKLFDLFGVNSSAWDIKHFWAKSSKQGEHTYSVFFKKKEENIDFISEFEQYLEEYEGFALSEDNYLFEPTKNLAVFCLFDLHLGKTGLAKYVGYNEDLESQVNRYRKGLDNLLGKVKMMGVEKVVFPIGNDIFNCEYHGATSKGTPQSNTADIHGMFKAGLDLLSDTIDKLAQLAYVDVIYIPSNHDAGFGQALALAIQKVFEKSNRVSVNALPNPRKYYKYGTNGFLFDHGELKAEEYVRLFPQEGKKIFSETEHHEVILGHKHHEITKEIGGITVRWMGALAGTDNWHHKSAYVGSKKRAYCMMYDESQGKISEFSWVEN